MAVSKRVSLASWRSCYLRFQSASYVLRHSWLTGSAAASSSGSSIIGRVGPLFWLLDGMDNKNIIEEFQARRRKVLRVAGPFLIVGVLGSLATLTYTKHSSTPFSQISMVLFMAAFFSCLIVGTSIVLRYYRCPACDNVPAARHGILFGLSKCPNCSARLK